MKLFIALFLTTLLVTPSLVLAQTEGGFGLRPKDPTQAYFRFTAQPGQVINDTLVALNDSDSDVTLALAVSRASMALTGGLAFDGTPPKADEAGTWLEIEHVPGEMIIPARNGLELPFKIVVPNDVQPGDYVFGFVATPALVIDSMPTASGFQVRVVSQVAVSVVITIPGGGEATAVVRDVSLSNQPGFERLIVTVVNTGAVGWQGPGTLMVKTAVGEEVTVRDFQVGYVLPNESIPYPIILAESLIAGDYSVEVRLNDADQPFLKTLTVIEPTVVPMLTTITATESSSINTSPSNAVADVLSQSESPDPSTTLTADLLPILLFVVGVVSALGVGLYVITHRQRK